MCARTTSRAINNVSRLWLVTAEKHKSHRYTKAISSVSKQHAGDEIVSSAHFTLFAQKANLSSDMSHQIVHGHSPCAHARIIKSQSGPGLTSPVHLVLL